MNNELEKRLNSKMGPERLKSLKTYQFFQDYKILVQGLCDSNRLAQETEELLNSVKDIEMPPHMELYLQK